jgi:E3 ubiquitin-protein ligase HECTD2
LFTYDEDSKYCYFNPYSFENTDQFFLVGAVLGLAIYNSIILDVPLPPFMFRKLLSVAPNTTQQNQFTHVRQHMRYGLEDLAQYRPQLARGLKQLLEYDGDVEKTFCADFAIDVQKYDTTVRVPLRKGGETRPVTNANRQEYVDLYIHYLLDTAVARQFEPFKRGFYNVCSGNAFSLFRPEEVELLIRGSDEQLDVATLRGVAEYENWSSQRPDGVDSQVGWFWEVFGEASPSDQRKLLLFITGSDRLPAAGASLMPIRLACLGEDCQRFPVARTCFNLLSLWKYSSKEKLRSMLWRAVYESEGFGLK